MKLPRVTVRRLMMAVAVVAILGALAISSQRRYHYRRLAEDFGLRERLATDWGRLHPQNPKFSHHDNVINRSWEITTGNAGYYRSMREKYERAARYPWLLVEPDPPEPEATP